MHAYRRRIPAAALLLGVMLLAACGSDHRSHHRSSRGYTTVAEHGTIYVRKNDLYVDAEDADTAVIHADASLTIDDSDVPVSAAARKTLNAYRAAYKSLAEAGLALGLNGVDFAADTMSRMLRGFLDGDPDKAGKEVDRRSKAIEAQALGLCHRMGDLRAAQEAVVVEVTAFKPYAVISADEVSRCVDDSKDAKAEKDRDESTTASTPPTPPTPATPPTPPTPPNAKGMSINLGEQGWALRKGVVVIDLDDGRTAKVDRDGGLRVEGHEVKVSKAAREALRDYHRQGQLVEDEGLGLGLAGTDMAVGAITGALHGMFGGDKQADDEAMKRSSEGMKARVLKLCAHLGDMRTAQQAAVAEAPEFKPYAVVTEKQVRDCGVRVDDKDTPKDTT